MSQTWDIDLISATGTSPATDITRIVDGFNALKSTFSGAAEPAAADQVPYMLWADMTTALLKMRNDGNTAFNPLFPLGIDYPFLAGAGQSWQNMSASRAVSTTYTNSTGRPIVVRAGGIASGATGYYILYANTIDIAGTNVAAGFAFSLEGIIPAGATYQLGKGGADTLTSLTWSELR